MDSERITTETYYNARIDALESLIDGIKTSEFDTLSQVMGLIYNDLDAVKLSLIQKRQEYSE